MKSLLVIALASLALLVACTIEPPLKLAKGSDGRLMLGHVVTELETVWESDDSWRQEWWYGWDATDLEQWGEIGYPTPTNYEVRMYYHGENPDQQWLNLEKLTIYSRDVHHAFDFGHHKLLVWSNIDTPDGTQVVIVNEEDPDNIIATTSHARLTYAPPSSRAADVFHNPEVFYANQLQPFYMSRDTADYDYYDHQLNAWIKEINAPLTPLVYIYLVQVVIYNNHDRIIGLTDNATINSLSDGVSIHTGHTSNSPVTVVYPMRLKRDLPARDGRMADIFGGRLTTFGLCDMEPWAASRGPEYTGSRHDLTNLLSLSMAFNTQVDSVYTFDITRQLQRQSHGGVVTIEIDADTLTIPHHPQGGGSSSGFDPVIAPSDSVTNEFDL